MKDKTNYGVLGLFVEMRDAIRGIGKYHNAITKGSIPESLKNTMVNPLVLVENSLGHHPSIDDILYACNDIYASLYIAVISRTTALDVDAVRVTRILEKLATDRDPLASIAAMESEGGLDATQLMHLALESYGDEDDTAGMSHKDQLDKVLPADSLAVGKTISITFESNGSKISVPVSIRLNTNLVSASLMEDIYKANYVDFNLIRSWKQNTLYGTKTMFEALTGLDYVKRQERLHVADINGELRSHFGDAAKEVGYSFLTGEVAINRASGVIIINKQSVRGIESAIGGRLSRLNDRERLMDGTAAMLMVVVDTEEEMITFYLKGIKNHQRLKFSQIKVKRNGDSNIDLTKIMGGSMVGSVPSLT